MVVFFVEFEGFSDVFYVSKVEQDSLLNFAFCSEFAFYDVVVRVSFYFLASYIRHHFMAWAQLGNKDLYFVEYKYINTC